MKLETPENNTQLEATQRPAAIARLFAENELHLRSVATSSLLQPKSHEIADSLDGLAHHLHEFDGEDNAFSSWAEHQLHKRLALAVWYRTYQKDVRDKIGYVLRDAKDLGLNGFEIDDIESNFWDSIRQDIHGFLQPGYSKDPSRPPATIRTRLRDRAALQSILWKQARLEERAEKVLLSDLEREGFELGRTASGQIVPGALHTDGDPLDLPDGYSATTTDVPVPLDAPEVFDTTSLPLARGRTLHHEPGTSSSQDILNWEQDADWLRAYLQPGSKWRKQIEAAASATGTGLIPRKQSASGKEPNMRARLERARDTLQIRVERVGSRDKWSLPHNVRDTVKIPIVY